MSGPDRRHAVVVARRVAASLDADRAVIAAALLHDSGKVVSGLGTYGRVVATVAGLLTSRRYVDDWCRARGFTRKVGLYLSHDALGADLLAEAGSDLLTIAWAREHHLDEERWSLPRDVAIALKNADDD